MDQLTGALWIGASFAGSLIANKNQYKVAEANTKAQVAQSRLQAAEEAYSATKEFHKTLSHNLALAGMGFGGVNGLATTTAQSVSEYFSDQDKIQNYDMFAQFAGQSALASAKAAKFGQDVVATANAATLADQLGIFKKGKKA